MKRSWVLPAVIALAGFVAYSSFRFIKESPTVQLVTDEFLVIRTPGGMLEVSTLIKNEEFGWSTKYNCPLISCDAFLKPTISHIRAPVHYTYRLPLDEKWTLTRRGAFYELTVPPEQPKLPPAVEFAKMQIRTVRGWLSPSTQGNREVLLRQLGAELEKRSTQESYLAAQRVEARKTVAEFAHKWMGEQGVAKKLNGLPLKVTFKGEVTPPAH